MTDADIFRKNILEFNLQLRPGAITVENIEQLRGSNPDAIILSGMGGSGTPATILQNLSEYVNIRIPIISWKDFGLPHPEFKRPLYIFVSFSGETREVLSGFSQVPTGSAIAIVAGGGALLTQARSQKLPFATFEKTDTLCPRQAYGLTLSGVLAIVNAAILDSVAMRDMSKVIQPQTQEAYGEQLAKKLIGKNLFLYTSNALSHIGQIFKISLNESAKLPASANVFPEINHNELSIFETKPKDVIALFITTQAEAAMLKKEIDIIKQILTEYETPLEIVEIPGTDDFEITLNAIVLAEWVGLFAATMRGINPLSIKTVTRIKELAAQ